MNIWRESRAALAVLLAVGIACAPARALVTLNDSHDHIFVTGSFGVSHDSNIFANSASRGDFAYNAGFTAEYTRRAGWIGVNASVAISASRYATVKGANFSNPTYSMELTKQTGRTTGSFTLSGARESRADAAVNSRSSSWNYNSGLNFKYPINERFTLAGNLGYSSRKYVDQAESSDTETPAATALSNLSSYSASFDLFNVFTNTRDLFAGYRYRYGESSKNLSTTDHAFTLGVSGRIISGINGSFRIGYQTRTPHGGGAHDNSKYDAITAGSTATYAINRKLSFNGSLSKDFSTTGADISVDTTTATLDLTYAYSSHWNFLAGTGWGDSRFLGNAGRVTLLDGSLGPNRHDNYATWSLTAAYSLNEHFKASFTYTWFENWSTLSYADFIRQSWALSLSSRW
jgi:hypothetical protein